MSERPRVTHVTPMDFGPQGVVGGGERYAVEVAKAMARIVPTRLLTFGPRARRYELGDLSVRVLRTRTRWPDNEVNPVSELLLPALLGSDVVHVHQWESTVTNTCVLGGRALGKRVYATDHGGGGRNYWRRLHLSRLVSGSLPVSEFGAGFYPELAQRASVIYGGVDTDVHRPPSGPRTGEVLFVGRLLRHKGVDDLVRAVAPTTRLRIIGRPYDAQFRAELGELARGKDVTFEEDADDARVVEAFRSARLAVLPSVYRPRVGAPSRNPELLGLTLLEAMACGTPVVCTRVGGMPEIVRHEQTGLVVEPGDVGGLGSAIDRLLRDDDLWRRCSTTARTWVERNFTWDATARRCLDAYAGRPATPLVGGDR